MDLVGIKTDFSGCIAKSGDCKNFIEVVIFIKHSSYVEPTLMSHQYRKQKQGKPFLRLQLAASSILSIF